MQRADRSGYALDHIDHFGGVVSMQRRGVGGPGIESRQGRCITKLFILCQTSKIIDLSMITIKHACQEASKTDENAKEARFALPD